MLRVLSTTASILTLLVAAACGGPSDGGLYGEPESCSAGCPSEALRFEAEAELEAPTAELYRVREPLQTAPAAAQFSTDVREDLGPEAVVAPRRISDAVSLSREGAWSWLHGTAVGDVWADGHVLTFDGDHDAVAVPNPLVEAPAAIGDLGAGTISVWVRYTSIQNGYRGGLVVPDSLPVLYYGQNTRSLDDYMDAVTVYIGHGRLDDPTRRQIYYTVYEGTDVLLCFDSGEISLEPDRWYHYAATIGPDGHHGYLNGQEFNRHYNSVDQTVQAFFSNVEKRDLMTVGHGMFGLSQMWWSFNGSIADLRIYDRVLGPEEIAELAGNGP